MFGLLEAYVEVNTGKPTAGYIIFPWKDWEDVHQMGNIRNVVLMFSKKSHDKLKVKF